MFFNDMTRKMPCWKCKSYTGKEGHGGSEPMCEILDGFLMNFERPFERNVAIAISGLTFDCSEQKEKE